MSPGIPKNILLTGAVFFLVLVGKSLWHHTLFPGETIFNTLFQAVATCLLAAAVFCGFYVFFESLPRKRSNLVVCLVGSILLGAMFLNYYEPYKIVASGLNRAEAQGPTKMRVLARLVDESRRNPSATRRYEAAHMAYILFGIKLPYEREDATSNYYLPIGEDDKDFQANTTFDASLIKLRQDSMGLLFAAFYVVYYTFITFLFGLLWLAVKRSVSTDKQLGH